MKQNALWFLETFGDMFFVFAIIYAVISCSVGYTAVLDEAGAYIALLVGTGFNIFQTLMLWAGFHVLLDWYETAKETKELLKKKEE